MKRFTFTKHALNDTFLIEPLKCDLLKCLFKQTTFQFYMGNSYQTFTRKRTIFCFLLLIFLFFESVPFALSYSIIYHNSLDMIVSVAMF